MGGRKAPSVDDAGCLEPGAVDADSVWRQPSTEARNRTRSPSALPTTA